VTVDPMSRARKTTTRGITWSRALFVSTLWAAGLLLATAATGRSVGRYQLPDSPGTVILHYEGLAHLVIPPKIYDLTVYADGRAVGEIVGRDTVEWRLEDEEFAALLDALAETGVFSLTTESIARAHARYVAEHYSNGGPDVSDVEPDRLMIRLAGSREAEGVPYTPLSLDITYDNVASFARRLPEVPELAAYSEAVLLLREVLRSRFPPRG
jgi:hypothetical protein